MTPVSLSLLPRLGGELCLDFVNSIDPRYGTDRVEFLTDYVALVDWAVWAGGLPADRRDFLIEAAALHPRSADAALARALTLRDHLYALLGPRRRDGDVSGELRAVNRELRGAASHTELHDGHGTYIRAWVRTGTPEEVLWPIIQSAAELMVSPSLERVRECDGHNCGWLFLDTSKAGRRRWCSMEVCGNRAKSQRYRRRARNDA